MIMENLSYCQSEGAAREASICGWGEGGTIVDGPSILRGVSGTRI